MESPKMLALITARGGSKGIPGKNIKPLLGKPLIAYTIEAAKASGVFDRIILSTDDPAIAEVAKQYGCEVPFMRPAEFADDKAAHLPVVAHALKWLRDTEQYTPEYTMVLQPTSPLRQDFHIREAVELAHKHPEADSVISVAKVPEAFNSKKVMRLNENGFLRLLSGEPVYKRVARRQDLVDEYWTAGLLILLFKSSLVLDATNPNFYGERTLPYPVDEKYSVDINEPKDWLLAEEGLRYILAK